MAYSLIHQSDGMCVIPSDECEYEFDVTRNAVSLAVKNPTVKQRITSDLTLEICEEYSKQAKKSAENLSLTPNLELLAMIKVACIHDVQLSEDKRS
ncbi:unnamed protein product [Didymodactylos carnosus]|uniref:Uncharacterized protein n=1 Tax=Didymodactylos carnosus TaxID=1234261 RepID=A0A814KNT8_9BILA|nr:unnamed protein product [Didymodactylos carnosus]CAF1054923.1 unnamed protein product [Didymodactylos carnosus]CAF3586080.1 unnamed protein product [Didymodactylos carnosus]CAF3824098.1 unnamed protein product [Didymodactylos carnosus]